MARVSAQTAVGEAAEIIVQAKAEIQHHIYGPRDDSTYRVEFRTSEPLAISRFLDIEVAVLKYFQAGLPSTCRVGRFGPAKRA
jgi:hypothetical protein